MVDGCPAAHGHMLRYGSPLSKDDYMPTQQWRMYGGSVGCRVRFRGPTRWVRSSKVGVTDHLIDSIYHTTPPAVGRPLNRMPFFWSSKSALYYPQAVAHLRHAWDPSNTKCDFRIYLCGQCKYELSQYIDLSLRLDCSREDGSNLSNQQLSGTG
jgi:hypothetical protein